MLELEPQYDVKIAGFEGDGVGPELYREAGILLSAADEIAGNRLFDLQSFPYNAEYYLRERRAWPDGTDRQILENFQAMFLIAFGDPRVPRGGMAHAVTIVLDTGRVLLDTNLNKRPYFLVHPCLRHEVAEGAHHFELFALDSDAETIEEEDKQEEVIPKEIHLVSAFREKVLEALSRAEETGKNSIIVVHKNNVLSHAHGAWEGLCSEILKERVSAGKQEIKIEQQLMDSFLERLVKKPETVPHIIVTDRYFGAILVPILQALEDGKRNQIPDDLDGCFGRENTEGMYVRQGSTVGEGNERVGTQIGKHTRTRIAENIRANIEIARKRGQMEITVLHVDDVHPKTYALWKKVAREVVEQENFSVKFMHAGELTALAITDPAKLNRMVIAADNILGDICGDAVAALIGGMGIPATHSYNTNGRTDKRFFEPLHGSAPDIAGQGKANPTATFLTVAEMFEAYGHPGFARAVRQALFNVIDRGCRTVDIGGKAKTDEFSAEVILEFKSLAQQS